VCGDRIRNGNEVCDDGNTTTEDSCDYGTASCTLCRSDCMEELELTGPVCGDGFKSSTEVCDDGNTTNETSCAYGTRNCVACNSTCNGELSLSGPFCGDGAKNHASEVCDDGNGIDETECPYGQKTCTLCKADCSAPLNLTGTYCGDGELNGGESCDDGNADACGACSATCSRTQLTPARGRIQAISGSDLRDGEAFLVSDGVHSYAIFEFDRNGVFNAANIRISYTGGSTDAQVAQAIVTAFQNAPNLDITATAAAGSRTVELVNDLNGSHGNQAIVEFVQSSRFQVENMSGGSGRDCPEGVRCTQDVDCELGLVCGADKKCGMP
jgi:cysteine-rich repeat protein